MPPRPAPHQAGRGVAQPHAHHARDQREVAGRRGLPGGEGVARPAVVVVAPAGAGGRGRGGERQPQRHGAADEQEDVADDDGPAVVAAVDEGGQEGGQRPADGRQLGGAHEVEEQEDGEHQRERERHQRRVDDRRRQEHGHRHAVEQLAPRVHLDRAPQPRHQPQTGRERDEVVREEEETGIGDAHGVHAQPLGGGQRGRGAGGVAGGQRDPGVEGPEEGAQAERGHVAEEVAEGPADGLVVGERHAADVQADRYENDQGDGRVRVGGVQRAQHGRLGAREREQVRRAPPELREGEGGGSGEDGDLGQRGGGGGEGVPPLAGRERLRFGAGHRGQTVLDVVDGGGGLGERERFRPFGAGVRQILPPRVAAPRAWRKAVHLAVGAIAAWG